MDNFREAMHGDAARTAALLLMTACSTDALRWALAMLQQNNAPPLL